MNLTKTIALDVVTPTVGSSVGLSAFNAAFLFVRLIRVPVLKVCIVDNECLYERPNLAVGTSRSSDKSQDFDNMVVEVLPRHSAERSACMAPDRSSQRMSRSLTVLSFHPSRKPSGASLGALCLCRRHY